MDRRFFIISATAWTATSGSTPTSPRWQQGIQYIELPIKHGDGSPSTTPTEVIEAFSYTCIHCYRFEPYVQNWLRIKPSLVRFSRLPSLWDDRHRAHARLYYTLQALGRGDLDRAVFTAIHDDDNPLFVADMKATQTMQAKFAEQHSISLESFTAAYTSTAVAAQLETDANLLRQFQITETPALVINRKYMTDASHMNSSGGSSEETTFSQLIELMNYLVGV
jgi:protein dithiol oxidoreductase (disulfide-forming)